MTPRSPVCKSPEACKDGRELLFQRRNRSTQSSLQASLIEFTIASQARSTPVGFGNPLAWNKGVPLFVDVTQSDRFSALRNWKGKAKRSVGLWSPIGDSLFGIG